MSIFNGTSQICIRAFMEGRLLTKGGPEGIRELAAPLAGKQGVYGVVHFLRESGAELRLDTSVLESAIRAAGAAFENALLYEQSNLLVAELRLINEITRRLNESLKLKEIYSFASSELISIFDADFCCILQHDRSSKQMIVQASNLPALEQAKFTLQEGYAGLIYETREPVIVSDYRENRTFASRLMEMTDSRSLIGCPLYVNGEVIGVILVTHRYPHYFTYDNYKLLQVLSGHIGLAMANASLHAEVRRMVITDNLTGLYTRHYLNEQVSHMQHKDQCGSLIVVDIDDFKGINDTYGHLVGDRILIQVSTIVRSSIRETDIPARWGGEELAIYLPQIGSDAAVRIAERIRCRVLSETDPAVTVSCGISDWRYGDGKISVESLFYKSDMALYKAKHGGKNQHRIG
ncbi:sensor domain-containing diguanylate cyclase [Paenibacillus sp. CC-CFT747]|nr:sensor domain-containing diguanylate cyclase [Paenibacillus sp. CC-CFT747]